MLFWNKEYVKIYACILIYYEHLKMKQKLLSAIDKC